MKKIDKLVLKAFLGPFTLTFFIALFIFLLQYLIRYFPDLVGKGLSAGVYLKLLYYFSINVTPVSLPLAILLSSLISFGNLGEHFELTAVKSSGISLLRVIFSVFIFATLMSVSAFFINNNIVPKANLKAFSLLYDVRQKKPTFDFKEGSFYNGLPGYSIKINKKFSDGKTMKGIIIYNHTQGRGNTELIMADSGKMFTIMEESYLVMELFNGKSYSEMVGDANSSFKQYVRNDFTKSKFVFSLESFSMQRTQEGLFASNKIMRNMSELDKDVDSLKAQTDSLVKLTFNSIKPFYSYSFRNDTIKPKKINNKADFNKDSVLRINTIRYATNSARNVKSYLVSQKERIENSKRETNSFKIEFHKKITLSFACLVMFLIGAPLGAIIKKGGLGVPVIISIIFFIFYYIVSMLTEKWAKEGLIGVEFGMWAANLLYLPIGLFFLRQARNDSRLLETDYFAVQWEKLRNKIFKKN